MLKRKIIAIALILQKVLFANGQSTSYMWTQKGSDLDGKDEDDQSGLSDSSGYAVALSADGSVVAIGSPGNDGNGKESGLVQIFKYDGSSWRQKGQDLVGEAEDDTSGSAVALSADGTVVAIGAPSNNERGHVRVFVFSEQLWRQKGPDLDGEKKLDQSGWSVALSADGSTVAIGSLNDFRIFQYAGSWLQKGQDLDVDASNDGGFIVTLSADGTVVAIMTDAHTNGTGYVRIFEFSEQSWRQKGLDLKGDVSGFSVALSADGSVVAIGFPSIDGNGEDRGLVQIFKYYGTSWEQKGQDLVGEAKDDRSGYAVALSADGTVVAIGAVQTNDSAPGTGYVRIFKYDGSSWDQKGKDLVGEDSGDESGSAVALSADGSTVVIGAPGIKAQKRGRVRIYEYPSLPIGDAIISTTECKTTNLFCYQVKHEWNNDSHDVIVFLKQEGCIKDIEDDAIELSPLNFYEEFFTYDLVLHAGLLSTNSVFEYDEGSRSTGVIKFCTQVNRSKDVQGQTFTTYSRRFEYVVSFNLDGNIISSFQTIDDIATEVEQGLERFTVEAYLCSNDGSSIDDPVPINQNSLIHICLTPSATSVKISNFNMNFENKASGLSYPVIDFGESTWIKVDDELTTVDNINGNTVLIKTLAIYDLFLLDSINEVTANGNVIFSFIDENERTSTVSSFALNLPVESKAVGEEGCTGKVIKKMSDLFS